MKNVYEYFRRDTSWLSFNYRVLLEAEDTSLPVYERIKFLSIHASNLEEFYRVRVAEHRSVILKKIRAEESSVEAEATLTEIRTEVTRQQQEFFRIFRREVLPELKRNGIVLYLDKEVLPAHRSFVQNYFREEIFPFLQPVMLMKDDVRIFIRDNRLYQVVILRRKDTGERTYALLKIPYAKVPRFVELPQVEGIHYYMFAEDIIAANLDEVFVGFRVEGSYSIKISRDADIMIDEETPSQLVENIKKKVKKRKIGDLSRFVYDRSMPLDCLAYLRETFAIYEEDLIPDNAHLSMEDLIKLPNPYGDRLCMKPLVPVRLPFLDRKEYILPGLPNRDVFLHYPYHTFDYFIRFLFEAASRPEVETIQVTQYRVAQDSEVISTLISAAKNGKKVTVFVELKARFDEENNLETGKQMEQAGIRIIYGLPKLKVHAKVALVTEKPDKKSDRVRYAYLSTGNFNEKTARLYSDMAVLTANKELTNDLACLFEVLKGERQEACFDQLLVAQYNLLPELKAMIGREITHAREGRPAYIILKMNSLQDPAMIDELYRASEAGVEVDLIVRGICCLIPNQPYSRNIRVTRIVDMFLEHSRVWYFHNDGAQDLYLASADWMKRNLYRRIETVFPVIDPRIKVLIKAILDIQLSDNVKACFLDEHLTNRFKRDIPACVAEDHPRIHAQKETYRLLARLAAGDKPEDLSL